ncbi:MAG: hypothetical protein GXY01_00580 [Clostridiales bacterium]|nr:hypothetical protein [Clostridiales bacterium]
MKKNKQDGVYFFWSASILVCMLIAVFVLGFTSCKKGEKPSTESPAGPANPSEGVESPDPDMESPPSISPPDGTAGARLGETEDMGQEYVDKFIFLGDSTTNGLAHYEIVPATQVWTPKSGTLSLWLWSSATIQYRDTKAEVPIKDAVTEKQPEYMLITLGVNGVALMDEEYFIEEYTNLVLAIKEASPDTKIILNSIYPVSAKYPASSGITNEKIDTANTWIERIADSTDVKYLDSASVLKGPDGAMIEGYDTDGIHLSADSFKLVINYLRTHGYK